MKPAQKVALFIFGPLGRTSRLRGQRPEREPMFHGQRQRPKFWAFLEAVAESDTETRIRVTVVALPILVIEDRLQIFLRASLRVRQA
jgi:hypothetical protein